MALTLNKNSASEHMVLQNPMIALIQNGMQWAVVHFQTQRAWKKPAVHPPMAQRRDMDGFALFALAQGTEVAGNFGESATCQGKGVQVLWPMCHDG